LTKTSKNIIFLILMLLAVPCFAGSLPDTEYQSKLTGEELAAKIIKLKKEKTPGQFIRVNKNILKFEGYIVRNSYPEYLKNIDNDVKVLVINCLGGDTYSGVKMGIDIQKRKLKVVVEGLAVSSAANYLFLAGEEKIIKNGVVGFHGNAQALLQQAGGFDGMKKEMKEKYKMSDEYFETFEKEQQETIKLEKEFYNKLDIPQQLFDITQTENIGLTPELKGEFDFLLPSLVTMKKFNIKNVSGEQNIPLAEAVGIKVIYW
jgi:ATP-dependent protease ClpP protease subunit